jgi:outer membrane protein assembly factor BamB
VWGDRVFLTTALDDGKQRMVFCVDAGDGRVLWEQVAWTGEAEKSHVLNGWASATCATDGEVVVAFFGKGGLHAYALDGQHLWSRDLGTFEGPWGTAASPVIVGDLVIQNGDSERDAFLEAFDRKTGKTVWRKKRPDHRGWSTPILLDRGGRAELVLNGHTGVTAYDPDNGSELWFSANGSGRGEPTVTPGSELLYVVCGLAGDMHAVRPGDAATPPQVVWTASRRGGRDLPSPIVVGDFVIVSAMNGIATCYDAVTGKELWKERLEGQFSSSPIAVGGLVFHQNEAGKTVVIAPGPSLQVVARNSLDPAPDELFRASLTPVGGRIYSRSNRCLYCIGS